MFLDYFKNDKFAPYFKIDDNEKVTLMNMNIELFNNQLQHLMDPSESDMITYIKNSHFSVCSIDTELNEKMTSLSDKYNFNGFMHIVIDGNKINNNIYYCQSNNLSELYYNIKSYNKEKHFEFFTRVEISHYTKEEVTKYNEDYIKFKYTGDKRKIGQEYLKETTVIINLQTGEEVDIEIPKWNMGYIVYGKYYKPNDKYELYSLETGKKILEYSYVSPIETTEHVIFLSKDSSPYSSKGIAIVLNKETGDIYYID